MADRSKSKQTPHYWGHRERLRDRFLEKGISSLADYEIIELLLTYIIPRRDTKPIAKRLLDKFGSIPKILDAEASSLIETGSLGKSSIVLFKLIRQLITFYYQETLTNNFTEVDKNHIIQYLQGFFQGKKREVFKVLYMDAKNQIIYHEDFGEGTETEASIYLRRIVESALKSNALSIILAHNHPGGLKEPSERDILLTKEIQKALSFLDMTLKDHIIIADNGIYSFEENGLLDIEACD